MHETKKNPAAAQTAAGASTPRKLATRKRASAPTQAIYVHDNVVTAPIIRIVPERDGGWLVLTDRGHGWLHGDRRSALADKRWLDANSRGRR